MITLQIHQYKTLKQAYHIGCSVTQSCPTICKRMDCSPPGFPVLHHLSELTHTHVHWVGDAINHLILSRSLLLLPSIFPSIRFFSNESALCIRWPKYWGFSFNISPSSEYLVLISFKINWFDLLEEHHHSQKSESFLWHHSSKASILLTLSLFYGPTLTSIHDY